MYKILIIIVLFMILLPAGRAYNGASLPIQIELTAASEAPILPIEPSKKAEKQRRPTWLKRLKPQANAKQNLEQGEWLAVIGLGIILAALVLFPIAYFNGIFWMFLSSFILLGLVFLGAFVILILGFITTLEDTGRFRGLGLGLAAMLWVAVILLLLIDFIIVASIAWLPFFWYILGAFILALLLPIIFSIIAGV